MQLPGMRNDPQPPFGPFDTLPPAGGGLGLSAAAAGASDPPGAIAGDVRKGPGDCPLGSTMETAASEITGRTMGEDTGEGTVWLTYHDLAERLRIKPASAKRRAIDRKWPKRLGNDGRSLVAVPREVIDWAAVDAAVENIGESADIPGDASALVEHLKLELAEARRELTTQRAELVEVRSELAKRAAEAGLHERTAGELRRELQARTDELATQRTEAVQARERAARAEGELVGLRSRGLWARLLGRG